MIFIQSLFRYTKSCFSQSQCTHSCVRSLLEKVNPHRKQVELDICVAGRYNDLEHRDDGTEKVRRVTFKEQSGYLIVCSSTNASLSHDASKGDGQETNVNRMKGKFEGRRGSGGRKRVW